MFAHSVLHVLSKRLGVTSTGPLRVGMEVTGSLLGWRKSQESDSEHVGVKGRNSVFQPGPREAEALPSASVSSSVKWVLEHIYIGLFFVTGFEHH